MQAPRLLRLSLGAVGLVLAVLLVGKLTLLDWVKDVDRAVFGAIVPRLQSIPGATSLSERVTEIGSVKVNYGMAITLGGLVFAGRRDPLRGLLIPATVLAGHLVQRLAIEVVGGFAPDEHVVGVSGPYFSGGVQRVVLLTGIILVIARPDRSLRWIASWAVLLGMVEATTRFVLGRHWPSDLLASFPIGLAELVGFRMLWWMLPGSPTSPEDFPKREGLSVSV